MEVTGWGGGGPPAMRGATGVSPPIWIGAGAGERGSGRGGGRVGASEVGRLGFLAAGGLSGRPAGPAQGRGLGQG